METTPTQAQVQAFVTKLEAFAVSLSAEEQTVFQIILAGGLGIEDEVVGYGSGTPLFNGFVQGMRDALTTQTVTPNTYQTTLSNVLKTRHDTVKNSIGNVR